MADAVLSSSSAQPAVCRLHVGNISPAVTADDLAEKFKVVGRVVDVYMPTRHQEDPSSSWKKGFAIVQVECDRSEAMKRAQPLNNTRWKGCTMHIGLAKPFYKDAILAASASNAKDEDKPKAAKQRASVSEIKPFSAHLLRVRAGKSKRTMKVSPEPLLCYEDKQYCKTQGALQTLLAGGTTSIQCPRRYILDEEMLRGADLQEVRPEALRPLLASTSTAKPTTATTSRQPNAKATATQEAETAKPKGTGVRKGFGTLVAAPLSQTVEKLVQQEEALPASADQDEPIDVSEEGLAQDRLRTLDLMKQILSSAPKPAMAPPPQKVKSSAIKPASSSSSSSAPDASTATQPSHPISELSVRSRKEAGEERRDGAEETSSFVGEAPSTVSADLQGLKSIFHRKGGVQWGESETLHSTNQVVQGHGDDLIFLEAEKLGMEIRDGPQAVPEAGKAMLFNFFSEASPGEGTSGGMETELGGAKEKDGQGDSQGIAATPLLSGEEILGLCRQFCREESRAVIEQQWRSGREQWVRDYKKKRREMTKKVGARKKSKLA